LQILGWSDRAWWLLFCGLNSTFVYYLAFYMPYRLVEYFAVPIPGYGSFRFPNPGVLAAAWMILFQIYYVAFRASPILAKPPVKLMIVGFPVVFSLLLTFMYPFGANDMYDHMFRGHMFAHQGVSPFGLVPSAYPADPFYPYVWWKTLAASYGPVWELLASLTSRTAGFDLWANVLAYKALVLFHFWGSMALVYLTLKRWKPDFALAGFVLFAWNPLLQFEFAGNGHSDGMLIFWMLAAVCLLVHERHLLALLALTVGVLVKFAPVLLVPLFLVAFFHAQSSKPLLQRFMRLAIALAAMAGVVLLAYLPFGLDSISTNIRYLLGRDVFVEASVPWLAQYFLQTGRGMAEPDAHQLVRNISSLLMAALVIWHTGRLFWRSIKTKERGEIIQGVVERSYEILFAYMFVGAFWFRPWYITWLLAFAPFLKRHGYAERTTIICFTSLANYFVIYYLWPWTFPTRDEGHVALVQLEFLLPFLFTLGAWAWRLVGYFRERSGGRAQPAAAYNIIDAPIGVGIEPPMPSRADSSPEPPDDDPGDEAGAPDDDAADHTKEAVPALATGSESTSSTATMTLPVASGQRRLRRVYVGDIAPALPEDTELSPVAEPAGNGVPTESEVSEFMGLPEITIPVQAEDKTEQPTPEPVQVTSPIKKVKLFERPYMRPIVAIWSYRGIWLGLAALVVSIFGQVSMFREESRGSGALVQVAAMILAAIAWSGFRDRPLLTPATEPRKGLKNLIKWRRGLALRLAGIATSLGLLWWSFQEYYKQPSAFFGPHGWLWLASMVVLILSCARWYTRDDKNTSTGPPWTRREAVILATIMALSLFTHLTWLNEVPWVIDVNEYTAWKETMRFYREPPSISMFTTTWLELGLPSMWFWFQAWPMRIFGDGLVGLRYITGLVGAVTVIPVYLLARLLWGRSAAVLAGFTVVFLTVILHNSRQSSNNIATSLWWTLCFYFLLKGLRTRRPGDFAWAGLWAGTSMYTYYGTRLLPYLLGVFFLYMLMFHFRAFRERIGHFALVAVGFMVGFGPLYAYFTRNPDKWAGRGLSELTVPLAIPKDWDTWVQYWNIISADIRQNFFSLSVIPAQDTFFFAPFLRPIEAVILVLGLGVLVWRWRQPASFLIVLWAGSVMLVASMINIPINPNPNFTHWAPAWPVFFLALALPPSLLLQSLRRVSRAWWRAGAIFLSLGFMCIAAADFYFYLVTYPPYAPAVLPVNRATQGRFLANVEPNTLVRYVGCCSFDYEYGEAFAPKTSVGQFSNASRQLPLIGDSEHNQIFYIPGWPNPYVPILQHYYPGGRIENITIPNGAYAATIFRIDANYLISRYGAQVTVTDASGQTTLASGKVPNVGVLPLGLAAYNYPVVATWSGSFYVNMPGPVQVRVDGGEAAGWIMSLPNSLNRPLDIDAGWVPFVIKARLDGPNQLLRLLKSEGGGPESEITTPYLWPEGANMGLMVTLGNTPVTRVDQFVGSTAIRPDPNYLQPGRLTRDEAFRLFAPLSLTPQFPNGDALGRWSGELYAEGGNYQMELHIDNRAQLIIDDVPVINNCNSTYGGAAVGGSTTLTPGWHKVELRLQTSGPGGGLVPRGLEWIWTRPDGVREIVPPTHLRYSPVAMPETDPIWPPPPAPIICGP
jgi:4-amino-4-deoxy-L-arabinose transferase-like glycosyltransferase